MHRDVWTAGIVFTGRRAESVVQKQSAGETRHNLDQPTTAGWQPNQATLVGVLMRPMTLEGAKAAS